MTLKSPASDADSYTVKPFYYKECFGRDVGHISVHIEGNLNQK
jgi:hypothetical protein